MRYSNALLDIPIDEPFEDASGAPFTAQEADQIGIFYPRWVCPVKRNNADVNRDASGLPDKLLVRLPKEPATQNTVTHLPHAEQLHCSLAEAKPWWVYALTDFDDLLGGHKEVIHQTNGKFRAHESSTHSGNQLLRHTGGKT